MDTNVPPAPVLLTPADLVESDDIGLLDYGRVEDTFGSLADLRLALRPLLRTSILSGLCVGSCFLLFTESPWAFLLHVVIYVVTLWTAVRGGVELARGGFHDSTRMILDSVAGIGLLIIGLAPIGYFLGKSYGLISGGGALLGMAFLLMAVTCYRHRRLYVTLARPYRVAGQRKFAAALVSLGTTKMIYETLWLLCCALPLLATERSFGRVARSYEDAAVFLAFAAFFGCIGYGVIWILMIIAHARAITRAADRGPTGFEVVMT